MNGLRAVLNHLKNDAYSRLNYNIRSFFIQSYSFKQREDEIAKVNEAQKIVFIRFFRHSHCPFGPSVPGIKP